MERFIAIFISIALICGTLIGCSGSSNNNENGPTLNSDSQREEGVSFEQDDSSATLNTEKEEPSNSVSDIDEKIEIAGYRVYEKEGEYIYFDILVLNATNKVINNVGIDINIIDDDGNITDTTYPNETLRVLPRQIIALQGIVQADKAGNISAEKYTYLDDEGKIYEDYFEDVKTISLLDVKTMYYIKPVKMAESAIDGNLTMPEGNDDIVVSDMSVGESSGRFAEFSLKLKNNTKAPIKELGADIEFIDEYGNIVGTIFPSESTRIQPSQSIVVTGLVDTTKYEKVYFTMDGYSYMTDDDEYINGYLKEIPKAVELITSSSGKTTTDSMGEDTNSSDNNNDLSNSSEEETSTAFPFSKETNQTEKVIRDGKIINNNEASEIFKNSFIINSPDQLKSQIYEEGELGFYKVGETNYSCWIQFYNNKEKMNAEDNAPSTSITFYDFDYSTPNPERMALFVQCFLEDKSYDDVVEFLKEKQAERPGGEFAKPSYFAYDNILFLISGYLGYAAFRVSVFDSYINYDKMDPVLFLYLLYNYSDQAILDEIEALSNEEAQKMVNYYRAHETDNLSDYNTLKSLSIEQAGELSNVNSKETETTNSDLSIDKNRHTCEQCGKNATHSIELFGTLVWYCDEHYDQVMRTMDKMENDVGNSESGVHTCQAPGCSKEGLRQITGIYGTTEYYCTEHYQQMLEIMESMTNGQ